MLKNHVKRPVEKMAFTSLKKKQKGSKNVQVDYKSLESADFFKKNYL